MKHVKMFTVIEFQMSSKSKKSYRLLHQKGVPRRINGPNPTFALKSRIRLRGMTPLHRWTCRNMLLNHVCLVHVESRACVHVESRECVHVQSRECSCA